MGDVDGEVVGDDDGFTVGDVLGDTVGALLGDSVGVVVGAFDGASVQLSQCAGHKALTDESKHPVPKRTIEPHAFGSGPYEQAGVGDCVGDLVGDVVVGE